MTVDVWNFEIPASPGVHDGWLSPAERLRAGSFLHPAARERFVAGRTLARWALAGRLGIDDPALVPIRIGGRGRPEVELSAVHFSISHAQRRVLVAVCDRLVGVDVEEPRPGRTTADLVPRCASAAERAAGVDTREFYELWTAKEACAKATGVGLAIDFPSFNVPQPWGSATPGRVSAPPDHLACGLGVCWINVGDGFVAAVAAAGVAWVVRLLDAQDWGFPCR